MVKYLNTVYWIGSLLVLIGAGMMIFDVPLGRLILIMTLFAMSLYQTSVIAKLQKQLKEKVEKEKAE